MGLVAELHLRPRRVMSRQRMGNGEDTRKQREERGRRERLGRPCLNEIEIWGYYMRRGSYKVT
jgi:hypothetical protein